MGLGPKLLVAGEDLYRQINPNFIQEGRVSGQAFTPTRKDLSLLSVDQSSLTTAEASFELFTTGLNLRSAGIYGVTVGEASGVGLDSYSNPLPSNPAHAVVDFRNLSNGQTQNKGSKLAAIARDKGPKYWPAQAVPEVPVTISVARNDAPLLGDG